LQTFQPLSPLGQSLISNLMEHQNVTGQTKALSYFIQNEISQLYLVTSKYEPCFVNNDIPRIRLVRLTCIPYFIQNEIPRICMVIPQSERYFFFLIKFTCMILAG
jgi:hypothetical protein